MDTMNQNDREESNVEEMEGVTTDEQSAAWREVARDAVRGITGLGWGYLFYLTTKLLIDLFLTFVP